MVYAYCVVNKTLTRPSSESVSNCFICLLLFYHVHQLCISWQKLWTANYQWDFWLKALPKCWWVSFGISMKKINVLYVKGWTPLLNQSLWPTFTGWMTNILIYHITVMPESPPALLLLFSICICELFACKYLTQLSMLPSANRYYSSCKWTAECTVLAFECVATDSAVGVWHHPVPAPLQSNQITSLTLDKN